MAWKASADTDFPLASRDRGWDGDAAEDQIFKWAGWDDDPDPKKARRAFFAYNDSEPEEKESYKLPFVNIIDGEPHAVPDGIFAVAQVLEGARGGVDLPDSVIEDVRRDVEAYYDKMGDEAPW